MLSIHRHSGLIPGKGQCAALIVAGLDFGALEAEEKELHLDAAVDTADWRGAVSRACHLWEKIFCCWSAKLSTIDY